jgi:hypothetical protein
VKQFEERERTVMDKAEPDREHGLDADRAGCGVGEGQTLYFDVLRIVIRNDGVDHAFLDRRGQRDAILFRAQGRRQLEEGAVAADIVSFSAR